MYSVDAAPPSVAVEVWLQKCVAAALPPCLAVKVIAEVEPGEYTMCNDILIGVFAACVLPMTAPMLVVPAKTDIILMPFAIDDADVIVNVIINLDVDDIGVNACDQIRLPSVLVGALLSYGTVVVPDDAAIEPETTCKTRPVLS